MGAGNSKFPTVLNNRKDHQPRDSHDATKIRNYEPRVSTRNNRNQPIYEIQGRHPGVRKLYVGANDDSWKHQNQLYAQAIGFQKSINNQRFGVTMAAFVAIQFFSTAFHWA